MKGVILAGGDGTRLLPLTTIINKHMLPVYNKPMIYHPLKTLIDAGINEILLVAGRGHAGDFLELLGSGKAFGVSITYEVQEKSGGIAQALSLAERWAGDENIAVILGDNIFEDNIAKYVRSFKNGAKVFLKTVPDPTRFGVPRFSNDTSIHFIEEKPTFTTCPYAVTGIYLFDRNVFPILKTLKPSARGELEISDALNCYAATGRLRYDILSGYWSDAGTIDSLLNAGIMVRDNR
jgi:glucose-1-phosphate thymidylyltransferase